VLIEVIVLIGVIQVIGGRGLEKKESGAVVKKISFKAIVFCSLIAAQGGLSTIPCAGCGRPLCIRDA
jgi:hypothetical protein